MAVVRENLFGFGLELAVQQRLDGLLGGEVFVEDVVDLFADRHLDIMLLGEAADLGGGKTYSVSALSSRCSSASTAETE